VNKRPLWIALWIAAFLWYGILWLSGQGVSLKGLRLFASIPGVILVLAGVFDRWAWRWPVVRRYLAQTPDVRGTWKGTLVTTWQPVDGASMEPISAFLVVRQTFTGIWARLLSERSASESVSARLIPAADGVTTMAAVYRNTPRMLERATSPLHFGAFLVELHDDPVNALTGHYWTDRETAGDMEFAARSKKLATSYEQAAKLVFSTAEADGTRGNGRRPARRRASATKPASRM
jgi:hypothetical protein